MKIMNDLEKKLAESAECANKELRKMKGCQVCKNVEAKFIDEQLMYICKIKNENVIHKCGFMCPNWK